MQWHDTKQTPEVAQSARVTWIFVNVCDIYRDLKWVLLVSQPPKNIAWQMQIGLYWNASYIWLWCLWRCCLGQFHGDRKDTSVSLQQTGVGGRRSQIVNIIHSSPTLQPPQELKQAVDDQSNKAFIKSFPWGGGYHFINATPNFLDTNSECLESFTGVGIWLEENKDRPAGDKYTRIKARQLTESGNVDTFTWKFPFRVFT